MAVGYDVTIKLHQHHVIERHTVLSMLLIIMYLKSIILYDFSIREYYSFYCIVEGCDSLQ